jgi:hypothetical protein
MQREAEAIWQCGTNVPPVLVGEIRKVDERWEWEIRDPDAPDDVILRSSASTKPQAMRDFDRASMGFHVGAQGVILSRKMFAIENYTKYETE